MQIIFFAIISFQLNEESASLDWTKSRGHVLRGCKIFEDVFFREPDADIVGHKLTSKCPCIVGGCCLSSSIECIVERIQRVPMIYVLHLRNKDVMCKAQKVNLIQMMMAKQDLFQGNVKARPYQNAMPVDVSQRAWSSSWCW